MTVPSSIFGAYSFVGYPGWVAWQTLTETSPPQSFTEPISLDEAKSFLKVPQRSPVDTGEDLDIQGMISTARNMAEGLQGRDLVQKQWDLVADYWPCGLLSLRAPLISVDLVQYRDSDGVYHELTEGPDYVVDAARQPGIIAPAFNQIWPSYTAWPAASLLVRFTSGYSAASAFWADDGHRIKLGMKRLVALYYSDRLPLTVADLPEVTKDLLSFGSIKHVG